MGAHPPSSRAHPLCAQKEQLDAAAADVCTALHRGGISGNGQSKVCAVYVQTHTSKEPGAGALGWGCCRGARRDEAQQRGNPTINLRLSWQKYSVVATVARRGALTVSRV